MKKPKGYKKLFEEILSSQEYHRLEAFSEPPQWGGMDEDEKILLAKLFVMQGEKQLVDGESQALESFKKANLLVPDHPKLLLRQAIAFSGQSHNEYCLKTACKIFNTVADITPKHFEVWYGWANSLSLLGSLTLKTSVLEDALKKFEKAEAYLDQVEKSSAALCYRDKGMVWCSMAQISGEPIDLKQAISLFQKAAELGLSAPFFWNDYGNAVFELSQLTNKSMMVIEAVELFWKSIKISPSYFPGWFNLGSCLLLLYSLHPQDAYYVLGNESFEQASRIEPEKSEVWTKWGQLQIIRGRLLQDIEVIKESIKKFETADLCEPNHPIILSAWSESLMLMASWNEDLQTLKSAQKKILQGLEQQPDISFLWYLYGHNLNELGRYHQEEKFYHEAIEKFRYGLRLDPNDCLLLHGLSVSLYAIGQIQDSVQLIEEACKYCQKAIESGGERLPQYWNDWGLALMKLALQREDKRCLVASIKKIEKALSLRRNAGIKEAQDVEWLSNLGCAYEFLGDFQEDLATYEKAIQIQKRVLKLDSTMVHAHYHIASCYTRAGELTWNPDLFIEANKHFAVALRNDPEDDYAWNEWGVALLHLAELTKDPARIEMSRKYITQAENKFFQSAGLGNTAALYHLACLHSLDENYQASFYYLEKCLEHNALPSPEEMIQDEWLENVRQTPEFSFFLNDLDFSGF